MSRIPSLGKYFVDPMNCCLVNIVGDEMALGDGDWRAAMAVRRVLMEFVMVWLHNASYATTPRATG